GCALHGQNSTMILSVSVKEGITFVQGSAGGCDVRLEIDGFGNLFNRVCSCHSDEICAHVVAVALAFNDLSMDNTDISEQLSRFNVKKDTVKLQPPFKLYIDRKSSSVRLEDGGDLQLSRLSKLFSGDDILLAAALSPEKFTLGQLQLFPAEHPLILSYHVDSDGIYFSMPESLFYSEKNGVAIDCDEGAVWRFPAGVRDTVSALAGKTIGYSRKEALIKAVSDLSDSLSPDVVLSGVFNLKKIELGENTNVVFKTELREGKVFLKIFLKNGRTSIEFQPRKRILEQNYPVNGRIYSIDPQLVKNIKSALADDGFRLFKNSYTVPMQEYSRIISSGSALSQIGTVVNEQEIKKINLPQTAAENSEIVLDVNSDEQWFSFNIKLPQMSDFIPSTSLVEAVRQFGRGIEEPVVNDTEGRPVILENSTDFLNKISEMIGSAVYSDGEKLPVANLVGLLKSKNKKILKNFTGSAEAKRKYIAIFDSLSKGELPKPDESHLKGIPLRKYQLEGFRWMSLLKALGLGGVLADEMGLGKTLQSLCMIKSETGDLPSIVVCPKTLVWSWDREIEKFFPEMERTVIDSLKPEERAAKWKNAGKELIITSYSVVINDFSLLKEKSFETVVIDEAQQIKNNNTKRFKLLSSLKSRHRFALTGTPLENHVSDLWSIFQFIMPNYLGMKKDVDRMEKLGAGEDLDMLRKKTSPFILRRLKSEILDELPDLIIKEYPVEMTQKQKDVYLAAMLRGKAEFIDRGDSINKIEILALLSKLRLAADHPSLAAEGAFDPELSGKIAAVRELCEEIFSGGGRVLIFSQYVKMLKIIEAAFQADKAEYLYMDGETKDRMELVEKFNAGEKKAFLLSLKVGGVGLNLTGADHVIIVDPWWNPAVEEQAWSRAHRIGQTKRVIVTKLYSKGTIEEKILNLHQKKRGMIDFFLSKSLKEPDEDFVKMVADLAFE
ncbi:DEAD/DEAH box helicase, partial [bacterium]|nr:DEAD/DEAH box helicase [bacterium]